MKPQFSYEYVAPPALFERFLHWCLPKSLKEPLVGDLAEEFGQKANETSLAQANAWYVRQAALTSMQYLWKNKKGVLMFILGILAFLATFWMAVVMSADVDAYINVPSLIIVLPPALFFMIGVSSRKTVAKAIRLLVDDELEATIKELKSAKHVFVVFGNSAMWLGFIGVIIGLVAISTNLEPERFSKVIGPAMAVCLLTLLYGAFIKVLCYAAEHKIEHLIINAEESAN